MKYLLVLLVTLSSCSHKRDSELMLSVEAEFEKMADISMREAIRAFHIMHHEYLNNVKRFERFFLLAKSAHTNSQVFYDTVDSILELESQEVHHVDLILKARRIAMDSLISCANKNDPTLLTFDTLLFSVKEYRSEFPRLSILILKNNVAINESKVQMSLYRQIDSSGDWFPKITTEISENKDGTVDVYLLSPSIQNTGPRATFIDTILLNGKVVSPRMRVTENHAFAFARFDNLENGHYSIIGKVQLISPIGETFDYPFNEEFEKK